METALVIRRNKNYRAKAFKLPDKNVFVRFSRKKPKQVMSNNKTNIKNKLIKSTIQKCHSLKQQLKDKEHIKIGRKIGYFKH